MNADNQSSRGPRIVFVGAGRMGGAVLQGALAAGALKQDEVAIFHPNPRRLAELTERFGVAGVDDAGLHDAQHVLLAVKPQSFAKVAPIVAQRHASFISLMAGVTAETIARRVGSMRVIRAMPNLGAGLGVAATALTWLPEATETTSPSHAAFSARLGAFTTYARSSSTRSRAWLAPVRRTWPSWRRR